MPTAALDRPRLAPLQEQDHPGGSCRGFPHYGLATKIGYEYNRTMVQIETMLFPTEMAAAAAETTVALIKKWGAAGVPILSPKHGDVQGSGGHGNRTMLTFRGVVRLAHMVELTRWGMPPAIAKLSASKFSHVGDDERGICEPYPVGDTYLASRDVKKGADLINVREDKPLFVKGESTALLLIDCEDILNRTRSNLLRAMKDRGE